MELLNNERLDYVNDSLSLIQKTDGLTFGTDALLLAGYVRGRSKRGLEIGGGTGIISMLLATRGKVDKIDTVEVQKEYAELIERNVSLNGLGERIMAVHADIREIKKGLEYDIVFSNPPYMKTSSGAPNVSEEKNIARHEVLGGIADFCAAAARLLRYGGHFYCVYRTDRMADLFCALRANRLEPKRVTFVHADAKAAPSMLLLDAVLGGNVGLKVTRPLIMSEKSGSGEGGYTEDMQQVMENGFLPQSVE